MKKIISILIPILAIFFLVGGAYYYLNSGNKNFKEEHSKYISLINDSYDFKTGLNGLETLTTEKAKETLRNIDNEVNKAIPKIFFLPIFFIVVPPFIYFIFFT